MMTSEPITNNQPMIKLWEKLFPSLATDEDEFLKTLLDSSRLVHVKAKQKVFVPGASCQHYLLLVEGHLRVQILTDSGRQVVLYHVNPGEDCVLTTSCLFANECYPAEGITDTDITVISIPADKFHFVIERSIKFRQFVFSTFSKRLTDVISRMELSYTCSIEKQLAQKLLKLGRNKRVIQMTHQELAREIGSVREVVSRQLKKFEKKQWIKMRRGEIELIDNSGFKQLIATN